MALAPKDFKEQENKLHDAIDEVQARVRYWYLAARRRRVKLEDAVDRYHHFVGEARHWLRVWNEADAAKDQARKVRAKRKYKRAHRKAAYWAEQIDDISDTLQKAVRRRKHARKKVRLLKKIHKELHDAQVEDGAGDGGDSNGRVIYNGRPCAAWLAHDFEIARAHGLWSGYLVSGVRTSAQSTALCYGMCGSPTCPGRCAGIYSNHNCDDCHYDRGAGDVTDCYRCKTASDILGLRYTNDLPFDRVHMSANGH